MGRYLLRRVSLLLLSTGLWASMGSEAFAHPFFASRVPNQAMANNDAGQSQPCITCHNNPNGGAGCVGTDLASTEPPCLNAFGLAFRANGTVWSNALAELDSDGDGFTNGQELQDPTGTWVFPQTTPGTSDYVTEPGSAESTPGLVDGDGDGYCWFGQDLDENGDCLGEEENNGQFDCDDERRAVHSEAAEDCTSEGDGDCDGLVTRDDPDCADVVDGDGDGFCPIGQDFNGDGDCIDRNEASDAVDCNDTDPTSFPGANENCVIASDNDCDGLADIDDPNCMGGDLDGDGFCPLGEDIDGDGLCEGAGEICEPSDIEAGECDRHDCNETSSAVNSSQPEDCFDGLDTNCDGLPDRLEPSCIDQFDRDGDGHCGAGIDRNRDGDCIDENEDEGPFDCDEGNPLASPSIPEICTDPSDNDCDGNAALTDDDCRGFLDLDGDGWCFVGLDRVNDAGQMIPDGDCADEGEQDGGSDCNDDCESGDCMMSQAFFTNPLEFEGPLDEDGNPIAPNEPGPDGTVAPICTSGEDPRCASCLDGFDNNCDGSADGRHPSCSYFLDADGDGFCLYGEDMNSDGDCDDTGEQYGEGVQGDLINDDPNIYPGAPENCADFRDNDQNGAADLGFCCRDDVPAPPEGGEAPCVPDLFADLATCARSVPADEQCVRDVDVDGDGYCPVGQDINGDGDCLDNELGENRRISDCDDNDPERNPGAAEICSNLNLDDDCDGEYDLRDSDCDALRDRDGDGYCEMGVDLNRNGDCVGAGEDREPFDCDDSEPLARPLLVEVCDDGFDNDCDGAIDVRDTQCMCADDSLCDDGDPCTFDRCGPGGQGCVYEPDPLCGAGGDAGTSDGGGMMEDGDGGCGCRVGPGAPGGASPAWLFALLGLVAWRRRR
ncbi:MAG: MopE-related protein [Myxococcota bacterium]